MSMELNNFLSGLAQAVLIIALPTLIVAVAYGLKQHADEIKRQLGKDKLAALESIAAVAGATASGDQKKQYALSLAQKYLEPISKPSKNPKGLQDL